MEGVREQFRLLPLEEQSGVVNHSEVDESGRERQECRMDGGERA